MKDRLYFGLAIGVGVCLIVVGGWYIYNSKFSDLAKLENCADDWYTNYKILPRSTGFYMISKKKKEERTKQIKWKSLDEKRRIIPYDIAFELECYKEFKRSPLTFRLDY